MALIKTTMTEYFRGLDQQRLFLDGNVAHPGIVLIDDDGDQMGIESNPFYARDYYFEIGSGNISGKSFVHKFGKNPDIDTGSFEVIWEGGGDHLGLNASAAETLDIFSGAAADAGTLVSNGSATGGSSITLEDIGATFVSDGVAIGDIILNDTQLFHGIVKVVTSETVLTVVRFDSEGNTVGGVFASGDVYRVATPASTGAAVVQLIFLLDSDLANETNEFVILNGASVVESVGSYRRNARSRVILAGSGGSNVGLITIRQKTTTANIFATMPVGYNETMVCIYTIPMGKEGHLLDMYAGLAGKVGANSSIRFMTRHVGEPFTVREEFSILGGGSSYIKRDYQVPKNDMPGGTDIKIMADTDTNNTAVAAGFDLILSTV